MRSHAFAALAILGACTLGASAQTLKPGLWEMTSKTNNPELDQAMADMRQQMAQMPPEQRRQMEAMMARQGVQMGQGGGMSMRMCMTREMVERNEMPAQQGDCKYTRQPRSGQTLKMSFTCANPPSSGEGEYTFLGPEAYKSRMTVRTTAGGKTDTMTMESSGKWLGTDCGAVKPIAAAKQ